MRRLRIVGGGLTGVLAALEAHRLGCRDIELHERFDALGGVCRTRTAFGRELRTGTTYFGPPGDPIVSLLEANGARFETVENRFGSVSPGGAVTRDFGGPALDLREVTLEGTGHGSLADRIAAYPETARKPLLDYCAWHLGGFDPSRIDADAAVPLGINRIFPRGADIEALARLKAEAPAYDDLYAIPRALSGRRENLQACLPAGGFGAMFDRLKGRLDGLGVRIDTAWLVSPRALDDLDPGREAVVWAANPLPLFKLAGLPAPALVRKTFVSVVFAARWTGPIPFYVQNFTAAGSVFRAYIYESGGEALVTAECVAEADPDTLRRELAAMTEGFGAPVQAREVLHTAHEPRWIYNSLDAVEKLAALRAWAAARFGDAFIAGAWETYGKSGKFTEVSAALAQALRKSARPLTRIA